MASSARKITLSGIFIQIMTFYENVFIAVNRKAPGAQTTEMICPRKMLDRLSIKRKKLRS